MYYSLFKNILFLISSPYLSFRSNKNQIQIPEEKVSRTFNTFDEDEKSIKYVGSKSIQIDRAKEEENVINAILDAQNDKSKSKIDEENKEIYENFEDRNWDEPGLFSNVEVSINLDKDSLIGKALGAVESLKSAATGGEGSVMDNLVNMAKKFEHLSKKFQNVKEKIERQNLKAVQGYVNPEDEGISGKTSKEPQNIPLGPEARHNEEFEERMQDQGKTKLGSFFDSVVKHAGPAVLRGIGKAAAGGKESNGPSFMQDMVMNVGPKILAESLGNNDGQSDPLLSMFQPVVKSLVESQDGAKENVPSAVSSIMNVVGGLAPLMQNPKEGGPRSLSDTISLLKPVLSAMAPSIMDRIVVSNQEASRKYMDEDPLAGGASNYDHRGSSADKGKTIEASRKVSFS